MRLAVEVVVDGECAEEVTALGGGRRDGVAVLLASGDGEVAERFLLLVEEAERLGDDGSGATGVEAVGEPSGVEGVCGVDGSAAVNVQAVVEGVRGEGEGEEREEEEEREGGHGM